MTNDEFLGIVFDALEALQKEKKLVLTKIDELEKKYASDTEKQAEKLKNAIINRKIYFLRKIVELPAYLRINNMSDIEIEDYKNGKIGDEYYRVVKITSDEIKEELCSKLIHRDEIVEILNTNKIFFTKLEYNDRDEDSLFATIALNPENLGKLEELLSKFYEICYRQRSVNSVIKLPKEIPDNLREFLGQYFSFDEKNQCIVAGENNDVQYIFDMFQKNLNTEFNSYIIYYQNLLNDINKINNLTPTVEDAKYIYYDYYHRGNDSLCSVALELLNMAQRKEKLSSYKLKSKDVQQEIAELDNEIRKKMNEFKPILKKKIINCSNSRVSLLKIDLPKIDESVNINILQDIIDKLKAKEDEYFSYLKLLGISVNVVGTNMKREIQEYESQKMDILQQIRELGGPNFENTVINEEYQNADTKIISSVEKVYITDFINMIKEEAKKQANMREEELTNAMASEVSFSNKR